MELLKLNIQMFADGKVVIDTDLDSKGFKSGLDKMQSIAKTGFKAVAGAVGGVSTAMAGALGFGVKYNAKIEQLETSFEVMTGSADEATKLVERLKKAGAETPYELEGLASTAQLLMQYGMTADEAYESTLSLGDIAQGSADKMQGIGLALGQMSSYGKVTLQDIKQMIGNGFNPLQEISERTGESMESLYDRISNGTLSVDEIKESFKNASSEGGKFYQSMEKQSKTLDGQFSTLKDNASSLVGKLSEGITGSITNDVLPSINDFIQTLEKAFSEEGFAGFSEALGQGIANMITKIAEQAPKFIDSALLIIKNFITGIQNNLPEITKSALSIVMQLLKGILDMLPQILQMGITLLLELVKGIAETLPELIPTIVDAIILIVETLIDNLDMIIDAGIELILALTEGIFNALPNLIAKLPELLIKLVRAFLKLIYIQIPQLGKSLVEKIVEGLFNYWNKMIEKIKDFFKGTIFEPLVNKVADMAKIGLNLVKGLWNGINNAREWVLNKIKGFGNSIVKGIKKIFGIHSPSTVMRDEVGKYLAQGMGVGFDKELDNVYNDMQRAIDLETGKMSANVQASGTYQMAMAGMPTFNLLDNSEHSTQLVVNGKVLAEVVNTENRNREVAAS